MLRLLNPIVNRRRRSRCAVIALLVACVVVCYVLLAAVQSELSADYINTHHDNADGNQAGGINRSTMTADSSAQIKFEVKGNATPYASFVNVAERIAFPPSINMTLLIGEFNRSMSCSHPAFHVADLRPCLTAYLRRRCRGMTLCPLDESDETFVVESNITATAAGPMDISDRMRSSMHDNKFTHSMFHCEARDALVDWNLTHTTVTSLCREARTGQYAEGVFQDYVNWQRERRRSAVLADVSDRIYRDLFLPNRKSMSADGEVALEDIDRWIEDNVPLKGVSYDLTPERLAREREDIAKDVKWILTDCRVWDALADRTHALVVEALVNISSQVLGDERRERRNSVDDIVNRVIELLARCVALTDAVHPANASLVNITVGGNYSLAVTRTHCTATEEIDWSTAVRYLYIDGPLGVLSDPGSTSVIRNESKHAMATLRNKSRLLAILHSIQNRSFAAEYNLTKLQRVAYGYFRRQLKRRKEDEQATAEWLEADGEELSMDVEADNATAVPIPNDDDTEELRRILTYEKEREGGGGCGQSTRPAVRIALVGDSISVAYGRRMQQWLRVMCSGCRNATVRLRVFNFAVSQRKISDEPYFSYLRTKLYKWSLLFEPDVVVVMMGSNDALQGWSFVALNLTNRTQSPSINWNGFAASQDDSDRSNSNNIRYHLETFNETLFRESLQCLVASYLDLPSNPDVLFLSPPPIFEGVIANVTRKKRHHWKTYQRRVGYTFEGPSSFLLQHRVLPAIRQVLAEVQQQHRRGSHLHYLDFHRLLLEWMCYDAIRDALRSPGGIDENLLVDDIRYVPPIVREQFLQEQRLRSNASRNSSWSPSGTLLSPWGVNGIPMYSASMQRTIARHISDGVHLESAAQKILTAVILRELFG